MPFWAQNVFGNWTGPFATAEAAGAIPGCVVVRSDDRATSREGGSRLLLGKGFESRGLPAGEVQPAASAMKAPIGPASSTVHLAIKIPVPGGGSDTFSVPPILALLDTEYLAGCRFGSLQAQLQAAHASGELGPPVTRHSPANAPPRFVFVGPPLVAKATSSAVQIRFPVRVDLHVAAAGNVVRSFACVVGVRYVLHPFAAGAAPLVLRRDADSVEVVEQTFIDTQIATPGVVPAIVASATQSVRNGAMQWLPETLPVAAPSAMPDRVPLFSRADVTDEGVWIGASFDTHATDADHWFGFAGDFDWCLTVDLEVLKKLADGLVPKVEKFGKAGMFEVTPGEKPGSLQVGFLGPVRLTIIGIPRLNQDLDGIEFVVSSASAWVFGYPVSGFEEAAQSIVDTYLVPAMNSLLHGFPPSVTPTMLDLVGKELRLRGRISVPEAPALRFPPSKVRPDLLRRPATLEALAVKTVAFSATVSALTEEEAEAVAAAYRKRGILIVPADAALLSKFGPWRLEGRSRLATGGVAVEAGALCYKFGSGAVARWTLTRDTPAPAQLADLQSPVRQAVAAEVAEYLALAKAEAVVDPAQLGASPVVSDFALVVPPPPGLKAGRIQAGDRGVARLDLSVRDSISFGALSGDWTRVAVPEVLAFAFKQNEYDSVSTRPDREAALRSFLILRAAQAVPRFPAEFAKLLDPLKARIGEEGVSPKPPIDPFAAGSGAAWLLEPPAVK